MKTKHTPAPWYTHSGQIIEEPTGRTIALIPYFDKEDEQLKANARLIAAAPELLEALKGFIYSVEHEGVIHGRVVSAVENARQAIAKATEGQTV